MMSLKSVGANAVSIIAAVKAAVSLNLKEGIQGFQSIH